VLCRAAPRWSIALAYCLDPMSPIEERLLGMFLKHTGIQAVLDTAIAEVVPDEVHLADGRRLPYHYAVVVPPFVDAEVVRTSGLGNASGFVEVQDTYQTKGFRTSTRSGSAPP
jgi:NADH dehydrogenase FAD-containing subunit